MVNETGFGLLIRGYFRNHHENSTPREDHEAFTSFMKRNGYTQETMSDGDTRLLLMDTYLAYIGDDRESYYRSKPFACIKAPKNVNVEVGQAVGASLRKMFGKGNVRRIKGSRTTLPYWSATVDAENLHWPNGKTTPVDLVNQGDDEITKECVVFFAGR